MESTEITHMWRELYVMLGTSSAALIGLFFIATSLHIGEVVSNPVFFAFGHTMERFIF